MHGEENTLEGLLRLSSLEPAHRPEFYRVLLTSRVYVLGISDAPSGSATLGTGSRLSIKNWSKPDGTSFVPFFSSLNALQHAIGRQESYVALPARSLFEITRGATLVLNPRSEHGKELLPNEIEILLSEGVNQPSTQRVVDRPTQVLVGQLKCYPESMIDSLMTLLMKHSNVKAAYIAQMHDPSLDDKPHLVIGIEGENDLQQVMREAGAVAGDTSPNNDPVDLMRVVRGEEGLSKYFIEQVKPFYAR